MGILFPKVIQGGMGVAVSNWSLAKAVAQAGQIGVVSGTALDTVFIRRLQMGDKSGNLRRALSQFPDQKMVDRVFERYFVEGGNSDDQPFKIIPLPTVEYSQSSVELIIIANFVEVFLAKEGHDGAVGINYLQKIQLPTLPSLFGAMLAGVDFVFMGAGLPIAIPGILSELSQWREVELIISIDENHDKKMVKQFFNPNNYIAQSSLSQSLTKPHFIAIVSSHIAAKTIARKATGPVDGFVVENHHAGGHNAPPRTKNGDGDVEFGVKDEINFEEINKLGKPYWLAGSCSSPESLSKAQKLGACGVQVGTIFAYCEESGITKEIKKTVIEAYRSETIESKTDFKASPTGYPFKVMSTLMQERPKRPCDLGYLRHTYITGEGEVHYRCPSEKESIFLKKGGCEEFAEDKLCLCNGLLASVGLGQVRKGVPEPPLLTGGEDFSFFDKVLSKDKNSYTAFEAIVYLLESASVGRRIFNKTLFQRGEYAK